MSYNLHVIGRELLARQRPRTLWRWRPEAANLETHAKSDRRRVPRAGEKRPFERVGVGCSDLWAVQFTLIDPSPRIL